MSESGLIAVMIERCDCACLRNFDGDWYLVAKIRFRKQPIMTGPSADITQKNRIRGAKKSLRRGGDEMNLSDRVFHGQTSQESTRSLPLPVLYLPLKK